MEHPYDVELEMCLHFELCRDLINRTGLTTTNQTEPLMRAGCSLAPDVAVKGLVFYFGFAGAVAELSRSDATSSKG